VQRKDILTDVPDSLGRTLVGGMGLGTALTLVVVPLFYTLIDDLQIWTFAYLSSLGNPAQSRTPDRIPHR